MVFKLPPTLGSFVTTQEAVPHVPRPHSTQAGPDSADWGRVSSLTLKGNQSWIFIRRTDAEAEAPILWPLDAKNWLTGKDSIAGKDWRQKEKGMTEDEMIGWHHQLDGHEFEQAPGAGDGQGGLACCSPWGHKKSNMPEQLNWTEGMLM